MSDERCLALPLPMADQIAAYVLACPTPPGVGAERAYAIVEALKGLEQVETAPSAGEAKAVEPEVVPAEILKP